MTTIVSASPLSRVMGKLFYACAEGGRMKYRVTRATITMSIAALLPIFGAIPGQNEKQSADRQKPKNSSAITIGSENPASKQYPQKPQDRIVIKTNLVNLTVTVSDRLGRLVTGLSKEEFEVYDDNVKQQIAFFAMVTGPASETGCWGLGVGGWGITGAKGYPPSPQPPVPSPQPLEE
jgi:hypothetical protein